MSKENSKKSFIQIFKSAFLDLLRCQLISVRPLSLHPQGDLGAIDDKYDVAISSSCGALDHIVVDTIDTAQACVNFLKAGGIGAATFIALDKVSATLGKTKRFTVNCNLITFVLKPY